MLLKAPAPGCHRCIWCCNWAKTNFGQTSWAQAQTQRDHRGNLLRHQLSVETNGQKTVGETVMRNIISLTPTHNVTKLSLCTFLYEFGVMPIQHFQIRYGFCVSLGEARSTALCWFIVLQPPENLNNTKCIKTTLIFKRLERECGHTCVSFVTSFFAFCKHKELGKHKRVTTTTQKCSLLSSTG